MEAIEDRKRKLVCENTISSQDKYEDELLNPVAKKFKDIPEEAGLSTGTLKKDNEVKLKPEPYELSETDEDNIFGAVKNNTDELCISEYRSSSSSVLGDFDQTSLLHSQFSCFLNEDGDVVLDQISASFSTNYAHDEFMIQPIIQEASPESPPSVFSPPYTPIPRLETIPVAVSNRKIPTSSWYSLIQDALDNMDGEATAREMVEYFEKNHKAHPFMKKTHWKQTVYTYLSKYFEKKFVGGSRDTIYTYTRTSASDPIGEAKAIARKKTKKTSSRV